MVKVICQHSGIEFEANTKRTKQHPAIADMKTRANRDGNYRQVCAALDKVKKTGGYSTIAEYMSLVEQFLRGETEREAARAKAARQAKTERKARIAEENELLAAEGYVWHKEAVGTEDSDLRGSYGAGIGEFSHYEWRLYKDGREVTKERALAEIKFGVDFVQAEEDAYTEDKQRTERAKAARQAAEERAYEDAKAEVLKLKKIDRVNEGFEWEAIATYRLGGTTKGVSKGVSKGIIVYSVWQTGDMDYSVFYTDTPTAFEPDEDCCG